MAVLTINVVGTPAPQGSKKGFYNQGLGRVQMVESSKKVKPWRQDVKSAVEDLGVDAPLAGPLEVSIEFYLVRPGYHFGTGRNAGVLKAGAPAYVDKKPDVDKLLRSTLDGLKEAGVYRDDAQVAIATGVKRYADAATGARITVRPLTVSPADSGPPAAVTPAAGETPQEVLFP